MIVYVDESLSQINRLSRIQFWSDFILGKNVVFSYQYVLCKLMMWYLRLFQLSIHIFNFQRNVILRKIGYQVWSLTQFYSVDFSQSRIGEKSAFSTNAQSRFASVVVDGVLGPPRLAQYTWRCPCISVVPEAIHEASRGPLKGAM